MAHPHPAPRRDQPTITDHAIGQRVYELRSRRGMTQEELAEKARLHVNSVKKIEAGGQARMETYHAIARALGVVTMTFVVPSRAAPEPVDSDGRSIVLADMRAAILPPVVLTGPVYTDGIDEGGPNLDRLHRGMRALVVAYHAGRYDDVAQMAPGLIRSAQYHVAAVDDGQRRDAIRLRGDLLGVTARYLIQIRAHDLAMITLRDAMRDAVEASDQPLAVSMICSQAWVMLREARFAEVERLCAGVADDIEPRMSEATPDDLAAWGSMLMRASGAAARNNRPQEAREYLALAAAAGARLGAEHQDLAGHKTFGPLTVGVKGPENELIAGHPDRALELAEQLPRDVGRTNPSDWNRHLVDRAQGLVLTGHADRATACLSVVRQRDPGWLRQQQYARDTMRSLLKARKRVPTEDQRRLAEFLRVEI